MRKVIIKRLITTSAAVGLAITFAYSQSRVAGEDQGTGGRRAHSASAPPKGAGYVLPDGTVQIVGWDDLAGVIERLDSLFIQSHPGVKFKFIPGNTMAPQHSLIFDETIFAPIGMEFSSNLGSAYRGLVHGDPFGIRVAHGSLNPKAMLSPLAIIVNKANPIESLSTGQITHIFTVGGRGPDIVYWSQAGVKSEMGGREIHSYGLPESDHYPSEDIGFGVYMFRDKMGMNHNARNYQMLPTYADVVKRVSEDPQAIGITALNRVTPDVKVISIAANDYAKPSRGTAEEIVAGNYPFDRYIYFYVRRQPGQPIDPFVKEYLQLVLSREGQQAIATEAHGYLPLNATEVAAELSKLE
jgi:phosphate transport system substrate-binding protein